MDAIEVKMPQSSITTGISETAIQDKGQQIADMLRPNSFGLYNSNPQTLSEWLIFIIAWPIFMPITFVIEAARWLMVATRFTVWHILGMLGITHIEPLLNQVIDALGEGNPFAELLRVFTEPESEFGASIIDEAIGGTVSAGLGLILDPILRPANYVLNENFQNLLAPIDTLVVASLRGSLLSEQYATLMAKYGYSGEMSQAMREAAITAPDAGMILQMVNRGYIDAGTASQFLNYNNIIAEYHDVIMKMRLHVPSGGDVYSFAASHVYDADLIGKYGLAAEMPTYGLNDASRNGMDETEYLKGWVGHWRPPNIGVAFDALHRGFIGHGELEAWYRYTNVPPYFRDILEKTAHQLVTQRYIRNLLKYGVWNYQQVYDAYKKIGFEDNNAKAMSDLAVKMLNPIVQANDTSDIIDAYKDRIITEQTAMSALEAAGLSEYEASLKMAIADVSAKRSLFNLIESLSKQEYDDGYIDIETAMAQCRYYGVNEDRLTLLKELWPYELEHTHKKLSETDLRKAYTLSYIDEQGFFDGLVKLNYSSDDANMIINIENQALRPTKLGTIPAGVSATGAIKTFTKAELKSMLIDGIISSDEWAYQMSILGYSEGQIEAYAQLILNTINKKAGVTNEST